MSQTTAEAVTFTALVTAVGYGVISTVRVSRSYAHMSRLWRWRAEDARAFAVQARKRGDAAEAVTWEDRATTADAMAAKCRRLAIGCRALADEP